jgi:simple sugar transport system permease protein
MNLGVKLRRFARSNEMVTLLILFAVMAFFSMLNPAFLTRRNMFDLLRTMIVTGILACGVMMVIINGGVDMSFMTIAIVSAYITARLSLSVWPDAPFFLLALVSCLIGAVFGLCNAALVNTFQIPVFIATLSLSTAIRGLMLAFVGNDYIPSSGMPSAAIAFSKTYWFRTADASGSSYGLHFSVFIMLGVMALTHFLMRHTLTGRGVYALGGDAVSASRIGFHVPRLRMFIFGFAGLLAGLGGIIYISNNRMADPMSFQGEELTVIAAVVLGGASIAGGKGSVFGVLIGLTLTNVINNNLVMIGVPSYWQKLTFGILILVAVFIQSFKARRQAKL